MAKNRTILTKVQKTTDGRLRRRLKSLGVVLLGIIAVVAMDFKEAPYIYAFVLTSHTQTFGQDVSNSFIVSTDQTLTPQDHSYAYYFTIPAWGKLNNLQFNIYFRHSSELIHPSSMTLAIDQNPVVSVPLDSTNATSGAVSQSVNVSTLSPGVHELSISVTLYSQKDHCADYTNPADWFVLESISMMHANYMYTNHTVLSEYPFPFIHSGINEAWRLDLVVPDQATGEEINVAAMIAAEWARKNGVNPANVQLETQSAWVRTADDRNFIFIGTLRQLPSGLRKWIHFSASGSNDGILQEGERNGAIGLIVTSTGENGLMTAGEALLYPSIMDQLHSKSALITSNLVHTAENQEKNLPDVIQTATKGSITLQQLGYGTIKISGYGFDTASFSFTTPLNWEYTHGAGLHLQVINSPLLAGDSAMTVLINGEIVKTEPLDRQTSAGENYFISFPKDTTAGEAINVTVEANMALSTPHCAGVFDNRRYVVVEPTSYFSLPHHLIMSPELSLFPNLFMGGNDNLQHTVMILPENPTSNVLTAAAMVAASAAAQTDEGFIQMEKAGSYTPRQGENLMFVGTVNDNPSLAHLQRDEKYPIDIEDAGVTSSILPVADPTRSQGGYILQYFRPKGGDALVLAAVSSSQLLAGATTLATPNQLSSLSGNVALETTDNELIPLNAQSAPYQSLFTKFQNGINNIFEMIITRSGNILVYYLAFSVSIAFIVGYLLWSFVRYQSLRRPTKRRNKSRASRREELRVQSVVEQTEKTASFQLPPRRNRRR